MYLTCSSNVFIPIVFTIYFTFKNWNILSKYILNAFKFCKGNYPGQSTGQSFFWFQTLCSCKTQLKIQKNLSRRLRYDEVTAGQVQIQHVELFDMATDVIWCLVMLLKM